MNNEILTDKEKNCRCSLKWWFIFNDLHDCSKKILQTEKCLFYKPDKNFIEKYGNELNHFQEMIFS